MGFKFKNILLHVIGYLFFISAIFGLSKYFYFPIKNEEGIEYIY